MKNSIGILIFCTALLFPPCSQADDQFSSFVFADGYLGTSRTGQSARDRAYVTQASRNDQARLNLATAGLAYDNQHFRARLVGQYGDSVDINYNAEPHDAFKFVQESYLGFYLSPDTTLDTGTFLAHIGAESWISKDNINYTRSLIAEFSPYYETGMRLSHKFNSAWSGQLLVLNGWQNTTDNRHPALGTQLRWEQRGLAVTSNTFFGAEIGGARLFHDLIIGQTFKSGSMISASADIGHQSSASQQSGYWWGGALLGKIPLTESVALNGRIETYQDPNQIIVTTPTGQPFRTNAVSVGLDVMLAAGVSLRGEVKQLFSDNKIFPDDQNYVKDDTLYVVSLNVWDQRTW